MARKPADQEEELRLMAQEVRGYVEAVMNSLAANVPKVGVISIFVFLLYLFFSNWLSKSCFLFMLFLGSCSVSS